MLTSYELLYIIPATYTDEDVGKVEGNVKALLEKHGATIDSTARLGKFRFTYPIKNVRYGHYVLVRLSGDSAVMTAIDAALRLTSEVLRYLLLRADDAGGEKFELVQFTEVNVDARDGKDDRRREARRPTSKVSEEIKSAVAVLEASKEEGAGPPVSTEEAPVAEISAEELDKKIDAALEETTSSSL